MMRRVMSPVISKPTHNECKIAKDAEKQQIVTLGMQELEVNV